MKILFSPSETKYKGGRQESMLQDNFIFPDLFEYRMGAVNKYQTFVDNATDEQLAKLFGTKKSDVIEKYRQDIFKSPLLKAIQRYEGVAYDYLSYNNLEKSSQKYIDDNVLIFSNLFGVLKASDEIPDYKLKQGESFYDLKIDKFYNDNFSKELDKYLENDDILDLRAGFYEKFYVIKKPYKTLKFIKDGKVVSHFAKAYRGEILKIIAQNDIKTFDDFLNLELKNLKLEEIKEQKLKTEIVYSII